MLVFWLDKVLELWLDMALAFSLMLVWDVELDFQLGVQLISLSDRVSAL